MAFESLAEEPVFVDVSEIGDLRSRSSAITTYSEQNPKEFFSFAAYENFLKNGPNKNVMNHSKFLIKNFKVRP